ncbi:MAG: rod shape-determining protein MreD [Spirochaetes bacterium]|nr:rod shape-determining protein MreD [Spirochaetota bacterium]
MGNIWGYSILLPLVVVQSTILHRIAIEGSKPDLVLLTVVYLANKNGKLAGQTYGFISGLIEDFLSVSPLGFNGFLNTLVGFLYGLTADTFFIDQIFIPMIMGGVATLMKGLGILFLSWIFNIESLHFQLFSIPFLIELGYNMVIAPVLFALLRLIRGISPKKQWEGY